MFSFNKLVQKKRSKMLILSVLLIVSIFVQQSTCINLTYIVRKEGKKLQPNCIADENERYSGIGWVYPLNNKNKAPEITTKFLPTLRNDYNCNFGKHEKCNKIWALKNWEIDTNSTKTLDLIFDSRWENFPTIFTGNNEKEFDERVEIPRNFQIGVSVRAGSFVELLLCEGWDPYSYPCYHFNITASTIFLRRNNMLPKNGTGIGRFLETYTAFANILSDKEWRNFVVNLSDKGVLSLLDVSVNRTVIQYEDKEALTPLYLLTRSQQLALWKIHQNQFMFTKSPQISRLGPILNLSSKDMCVTLFVSTCSNCELIFFVVKDNEKKNLIQVEPTQNSWRLVKLKDNGISTDKVNIFVETKFSKTTNETEGFWAIDDVRVCHENEVKVSFLKLQDDVENDDEISCQVIQHPKWRPKKLTYSQIQEFPKISNSSNSTSILLNWTQEDPNYEINYFIEYEANDLCPEESPDLKRIKSNGFLMTKHNEIVINNLIPYTTYNITFSSMLHETSKHLTITTQETAKPQMDEIPIHLNIQVTDTKASVSWDKVNCWFINGPILYSLKIKNLKDNTVREIGIQNENTVEINDLPPYTLHSLYITTARSFDNLQNNKNTIEMSSNFTTQPGKGSLIENVELYSKDANSASFRYDLPKSPNGIPVSLQIIRCNALSFKKCKTAIFDITPCKLWPKKYCVEMNYLMAAQSYNFKISVRNEGSQFYGEELTIKAFMDDQVPAPPTNVTYKIVDCEKALDYCHLNISWYHPYQQNGTILSFHIVLNATDPDSSKNIQEVLTIFNSSYYLPKYEYQVKYTPFSTHYELYIQSVNSKFKSSFTHIHVKTDDVGDHIEQNPVLVKSSPNSVNFKLPILDPRLKSYKLTTIVQDFNMDIVIPQSISKNKKITDHLCHNFGETWLLEPIEISSHETETLEIGTNEKKNKFLEAKTKYCFTFIVTNVYRDTEHDVVYYKKLETPELGVPKASSNYLYLLLFLLLLIPIAFFVYRYMNKRRTRKRSKNENKKENEYESLPFEECEENCVNNETYDELLHK